jgi:hypothetical protein
MPTALEVAAEYRRQLDQANLAAIARLTRAYRLSLDRLTALLDLLFFELGEGTITRGRLFRLQRYIDLIEQIRVELAGLQSLAANEIATGGRLWVTRGELAAREILAATTTRQLGIAGQFNRLPTDAVETLLGFLDPTGPLYDRLRQLAPTTFQTVIDRMVTGITLGQNPRVIARALTGAYGQGLTDAVRMVRTAQVYAYREANRASMIANSDVVQGWYWWSQLIPGRTCMSCVAMHGTLHPLDESLNDHHNGLCVPLPAVEGFPNPVDGSGEDWFRAQSAAVQRQMMGPGKFDAWTNGLVQIPDMTGQHEDPVYGFMRVERPLKDLVPAP